MHPLMKITLNGSKFIMIMSNKINNTQKNQKSCIFPYIDSKEKMT